MNRSSFFICALLFLAAHHVRAEGGEIRLHSGEEFTEAQRATIDDAISRNLRLLEKRGRLPKARALAAERFIWPLKAGPNLSDPGAWEISNFVDHDSSADSVLDYYGGERTYDGHRGTDIALFPFPWNKMAGSDVLAVAAADGILLVAEDGNDDKSCSFSAPNTPNYVVVRHASGTETRYLHLKRGSVTTKAIGSEIKAGDVIGAVGSSGMSTGPHLHFEVYDGSQNLIDPFYGSYNPTTESSWWMNQRSYVDPGINKVTIGTASPELFACTAAKSHESGVIRHGQKLFATTYYRERGANEVAEHVVFRPDGSTFDRWTQSASTFYVESYWYRYWTIDSSQPTGRWRYRSSYNGQTVEKTFYVCASGAPPETPRLLAPRNGSSTGRSVTLDWREAKCTGSYRLEVREGSRRGRLTVRARDVMTSRYKISRLLSRHQYFWQVSSCTGSTCRRSRWQSFKVR